MKGIFWKKASAACMAVMLVSGNAPLLPITKTISDFAIVASAEDDVNNGIEDPEIEPVHDHSWVCDSTVQNNDGSMTFTFTCPICYEQKEEVLAKQYVDMLKEVAQFEDVKGTWNWMGDYSAAALTLTNLPLEILGQIDNADIRNALNTHGFTVLAETIDSEEYKPDCYRPGYIKYTAKALGYTDVEFYETSEPLGHNWGEPVWTWAADYSTATAAFECQRCHEIESGDAVVTSETTEATRTEDGKIVYTATVDFHGTIYTDTKVVTIPKFEIFDISAADVILSGYCFDFDGEEKSVKYTVKYGNKVLEEGVDFYFEGDAVATDAGFYVVKAKGIGHYEGEAQAVWKIVPPDVVVTVNGEEAEGYEFGEAFTVTAPEAEEGKKFVCWEANGEIVSFTPTYRFVVKNSVDLVPVYFSDEAYVKKENILSLKTSKWVYNDKDAVCFDFNHSLTDDYKVQEVGLIYATNKTAGADTSVSGYQYMDLTDSDSARQLGVADVENVMKNNTTGKIKKRVANYKKSEGLMSFSYAVGDNKDCYIYAIGYIKVVKDGVEETLYTDLVSTTYNTIG